MAGYKWLSAVCMFVVVSCSMPGFAQQIGSEKLAGDWSGSLSVGETSLPLVLHLRVGTDGKLTVALDSPAQGATGLAGANVELNASNFRFDVPSVHGTYSGMVSADGKTISGTWSQGKPLPLVLKQTASAADLAQVKASPVDGDWAGVLRAGEVSLSLVLHLHAAPGGKIEGSLDSLDQGSTGIACDNVTFEGQKLTFDVPAVRGNYAGTLSSDGNKLSGTWTQGSPLPLELTRETKHTRLAEPASAGPPVALKDLQPVLDREFEPVVRAWPEGGTVVGVLDHGGRKIFSYGTAKPDSIFEIGSVTKTFTALTLAQMVQQGAVTLDEPVRQLLPPGTVAKPASGPEIALLDLATQHSGLPRLPGNLTPKSQADPYADYTSDKLYDYLAKRGVGRPEKPDFLYSNLGFGLLGQALAEKERFPFDVLIKQQVLMPLGMNDTAVALSPSQQERLIQGYSGAHDKAHVWNFQAMAGAGALRSTADDLLTYCEAYLHPEKLATAATGPASTLAAALRMTEQPQADGPGNNKVALAWLIRSDTGVHWHDGGTSGYSSLVMFDPKPDRAIVVLYNCLDLTPGIPQLVDRVAANVTALMDGKPVPPIEN